MQARLLKSLDLLLDAVKCTFLPLHCVKPTELIQKLV